MSIPVVDLSGPREAVVRQIDDALLVTAWLSLLPSGHGANTAMRLRSSISRTGTPR